MNANQLVVGRWYWVWGNMFFLVQKSVTKGYHQFHRLDIDASVEARALVSTAEYPANYSSRSIEREVEPADVTAWLDQRTSYVEQSREFEVKQQWAEILHQELEIVTQVKLPLLGLPTSILHMLPLNVHRHDAGELLRDASDFVDWVDALIAERVKAGVPLSPLEAKRQREEAERDAV